MIKAIPGYEDRYEISEKSEIFRIKRVSDQNHLLHRKKLTQSISKGYLCVGLTNSCGTRTHFVHVLMAMAFLDHKPNGFKGLIVDHIDDDQLNNNRRNIQLITTRENRNKSIDKSKTQSKYPGVSKKGNRWQASVQINRNRIYLGLFKTEKEAYKSYKNKIDESTSDINA